jgi:hypothetical protein
MIIFIIDVIRIFPDEGEGHSPVATDLDGPSSLSMALQLMKS